VTSYFDKPKSRKFDMEGNINFPGNKADGLRVLTSIVSWQDTKLGLDNPGYKDQIRNRSNATTGYFRNSLVVERTGPTSMKLHFRNSTGDSGDQEYSGPFIPSGSYAIEPFDFGDLYNQALMRFVADARQKMTSFQGATFLGELRETIHMIRHPADALRQGIGNYLKSLKRLKSNSGFRRMKPHQRRKAVAGTWLEYAYGWRPLMSDIDSAAKALANNRHLSEETTPVHGVAREMKSYGGWVTTAVLGTTTLRCDNSGTLESSVRFTGAIFTEASNPLTYQARNFGFDPSSWIPTLWELIPYSFLVDYFSNVGAIIDAYSLPNSRLAWGCYTRRNHMILKGQTSWSWDYPPGGSGIWQLEQVSQSPGIYQVSMRRFARSSLTEIPVPSLVFRVPGFERNWRQWANMSALLAQSRRLAPM
jgi:hypothetical protein